MYFTTRRGLFESDVKKSVKFCDIFSPLVLQYRHIANEIRGLAHVGGSLDLGGDSVITAGKKKQGRAFHRLRAQTPSPLPEIESICMLDVSQ